MLDGPAVYLVRRVVEFRPVSMPPNPCFHQPSPKACALGSFFYDSSAPSEFLRQSSRPAPFSAGPLPHSGFVPHRGITRCRPLTAGVSNAPLRRRPQAFSASRRFLPAFWLRGFISPHNHVQGSPPSRGFSIRVAVPARRWDGAPLPFKPMVAHWQASCHFHRPRLRGFPPHGAALFTVWG
jgi:hypothetical protein